LFQASDKTETACPACSSLQEKFQCPSFYNLEFSTTLTPSTITSRPTISSRLSNPPYSCTSDLADHCAHL